MGMSYNRSNVETADSTSTDAASSATTSMGTLVSGDYFFKDKFSLTAGYFISLYSDIDSEVEEFDIGVKYYYLDGGYKFNGSIFGNTIKTSPSLSPYAYIGYSSTKFQFSNFSINFKGIKAELGGDWHFSKSYFARAKLYFQAATNSSQRTMSNAGLSFGIGTSF